MATTKIQAAPQTAKRSFSAGSVISAIGRWIVRNRIYLIAFAIPAVLTYLAYALFGLYPFGEESVLCLDRTDSMCIISRHSVMRSGVTAASSTTGREIFPASLWALLAIIWQARSR